MGYTTCFTGEFHVTPRLSANHCLYLKEFSRTRRMKRKASMTAAREDPVRESVGLPVGDEGGFFVGAAGFAGQEWDASDVEDANSPPLNQPGMWCQWVPNDDGTVIEWNEEEKFYYYVEWLQYLIDHFLELWGYRLHGRVEWEGERSGDTGVIYIQDNRLAAQADIVTRPNAPIWWKES